MFSQHDRKAKDIKWDFAHFLEKLEYAYKISFKHTEYELSEQFLNEVVGYERVKD